MWVLHARHTHTCNASGALPLSSLSSSPSLEGPPLPTHPPTLEAVALAKEPSTIAPSTSSAVVRMPTPCGSSSSRGTTSSGAADPLPLFPLAPLLLLLP